MCSFILIFDLLSSKQERFNAVLGEAMRGVDECAKLHRYGAHPDAAKKRREEREREEFSPSKQRGVQR